MSDVPPARAMVWQAIVRPRTNAQLVVSSIWLGKMSMFSSTDMNPHDKQEQGQKPRGRDINPHFFLECSKKLGSMVSK